MKIHFKLIGSVFSSFRRRLLVPHSDDSSSVTLYGVSILFVVETSSFKMVYGLYNKQGLMPYII
jgi:hypothetical protein